MAEAIALVYEIHLQGPLHCGSGYVRGLLDRAVVRNGKGDLYVPGSTIKGKVRHAAEQIATTLGFRSSHFSHRPDYRMCQGAALCDVCRLFGSPRAGEKLFFADATIHEDLAPLFHAPGWQRQLPVYQTWERTQVAMHRRTGIAAEGRLFSSEFAVPVLVFRGSIDGTIDTSTAHPQVSALHLLLASLWTIEGLGGDGTRGAGRCAIEVTSLRVNDVPIADPKALLAPE